MNTNLIDFTIGADPEFACSQHGRIISAEDYVEVGDGEGFGADGNHVTFELRPAPSNNPLEIVNNIRNIFIQQVIKQPKFLDFTWVSGSWYKGYALGGHVHFGLSNSQINQCDAVKILDSYVGSLCLLIEKKVDAQKRRRTRYGCMGDMRIQDWGFEYRPMSSWLSSPYVAAAMLCLSKAVMYEIMNNSEFQWNTYVTPSDFQKVDQDRLRKEFPKIWKDITKLHLYQAYKPYIDLIYFMIKNKLTWLPKTDMKQCWGIMDMKQLLSSKIGVNVLWNRYNIE